MATKGQKPIPIGLARSMKTKRHNYTSPKKPDHGSGQPLDVAPKIPRAPKLASGRNVLGKEGMREYRRITGLLTNARVVAEIDRTVLTQYCALWEMFCTDKKEFTAAQHTQMRLCAVELGLTPSARSRLRG